MKKEKKVKLYFTESDARKIKNYATDNKIKFWTETGHFQFDLGTAVVTGAVAIILIVLIAAFG